MENPMSINWLEVQKMLYDVAIGDVRGDVHFPKGYKTPSTAQAIRNLNNIMMIPESLEGWGSAQTNAITRLIHCKPSLKYGDTGPYVKYAQYLFHNVKIDGKFKGETRIAVIMFQKEHNIKRTGIVNNTTWDFLINSYRKLHYRD